MRVADEVEPAGEPALGPVDGVDEDAEGEDEYVGCFLEQCVVSARADQVEEERHRRPQVDCCEASQPRNLPHLALIDQKTEFEA